MCHGSCAALYKDPANCGGCDQACSAELVCSDGKCATHCGPGTAKCGASCVDVAVDRDNCGYCGHACGVHEVCVAGQCSSTCDGQALCIVGNGAYCASTATDNANCGKCGVVCGTQEVCRNSSCASECEIGQALCGSECVALASDHDNCGSCGHPCLEGQYCVASACACPTGTSVCGSTCVDLLADTSNCGSCGRKCSGTCAHGLCTITVDITSNAVGALAIDGGFAYFVQSTGELDRTTTLGKQESDLATTASFSSIAVDASYVYWPSAAAVDFVPIDGGQVVEQSLPTCTTATEVVADGTNVYVACAEGIVAFPSGGGTPTTLADAEAAPHGLCVVSGMLFWADALAQVRAEHTDGTSLETLAAMPSAIGDVACDATSAYFAWNGSDVLAVSVAAPGYPLVLASGISGPARLVSDGVSVYFLDATEVAKVPVGGGATTNLVPTGGDANDLAIDTGNVYWTTSSGVERLEGQ